MNLTTLGILILVFSVLDFAVVHFVPATSTGVALTLLNFFLDVNKKAKAFIDTAVSEVTKNWHEFVLLWVIFLVLYSISPLFFAFVLTGYLSFRLVFDKEEKTNP